MSISAQEIAELRKEAGALPLLPYFIDEHDDCQIVSQPSGCVTVGVCRTAGSNYAAPVCRILNKILPLLDEIEKLGREREQLVADVEEQSSELAGAMLEIDRVAKAVGATADGYGGWCEDIPAVVDSQREALAEAKRVIGFYGDEENHRVSHRFEEGLTEWDGPGRTVTTVPAVRVDDGAQARAWMEKHGEGSDG